MKKNIKGKFFKGASFWIFFVLAAILLSNYLGKNEKSIKALPYSEFRKKLSSGRISNVKVGEAEITGKFDL